MIDQAAFYGTVRQRLGPLKTSQIEGTESILAACEGAPLAHAAYMLATCWHETNKTMQPVREAYWLSEEWRKAHLRYWPFYGRGYVQITWEAGYKRAGDELGLGDDLVRHPDRVMDQDIAAKIMRRGMDEGWFTGVKLSTFLPSSGVATREQYMHARTIINGRDKADLVEDYAQVFERALREGGWA